MGSKSDLEVMQPAADILTQMGISNELRVISAHRTPELLHEYVKAAPSRGMAVIIAGAGGAAHLPGVTAALTHLPVIGVPVRGSDLGGLDSLLSMVQMPKGVPVATVGLNNAQNAGLLAARMLALKYDEICEKVKAYAMQLAEDGRENMIV